MLLLIMELVEGEDKLRLPADRSAAKKFLFDHQNALYYDTLEEGWIPDPPEAGAGKRELPAELISKCQLDRAPNSGTFLSRW